MDRYPLQKCSKRTEKLVQLAERAHKRVVGQERSIQAVYSMPYKNRAGLQVAKDPLASSFFRTTRGRKTELAKNIGRYLFDDENA